MIIIIWAPAVADLLQDLIGLQLGEVLPYNKY